MQLVKPTNGINRSLSIILAKGLNIYVDLKIGGSADKENIIRLQIADKKILHLRVKCYNAHKCNNSYICGRGCKPLRPQM